MAEKKQSLEERLYLAIARFAVEKGLEMPNIKEHKNMLVINFYNDDGAPILPMAIKQENKRLVEPVLIGYYTTPHCESEFYKEFMEYLKKDFGIESEYRLV